MARMHTKFTVIIVDGNDISQYCSDSNCAKKSDTEDNTMYGKNSRVFDPTLLVGEFGCSGKYNTETTGPRAVLKPLVGTKVRVKYRPEGSGANLPQDDFEAVITGYTETAPVGGYRAWALETTPSDDWIETPQTT